MSRPSPDASASDSCKITTSVKRGNAVSPITIVSSPAQSRPVDTTPGSSQSAGPVHTPTSQHTSKNSSTIPHRPSLSEPQWTMPPPPSPRQTAHHYHASHSQGRQGSLTHAQIQEMLIQRPAGVDGKEADPRFKGRDWQHIEIGELIGNESGDGADEKGQSGVTFVEMETGIEEATNLLIASSDPVLLIRANSSSRTAVATFDYRDLTQYLLFATGQLKPESEEELHLFQTLAQKARAGDKIPLCEAKALGVQDAIVTLPSNADLMAAVKLFGGGVHRILITRTASDGQQRGGAKVEQNEVIGILYQLSLMKFLWENGRSFPVIDRAYGSEVRELGIGSPNVISINGDRLLKEALILMNNEGVTSVAVVDSALNVVGNISNVDVKLLTKSSSAPLLDNTCIHFISVILSTRGMNDGKDSFPAFYINPRTSLAHTVAKLIATKSHRMWIVESQSGTSTPALTTHATPLLSQARPHGQSLSAVSGGESLSSDHDSDVHAETNATEPKTPSRIVPSSLPAKAASITSVPSPSVISQSSVSQALASPRSAPHPPHLATSIPQAQPPFHPQPSTPSISAAALPGQHISGRLSGVVSLTDILNLFARRTGLAPDDPEEARRGRRRGSSTSTTSSVSAILGAASLGPDALTHGRYMPPDAGV